MLFYAATISISFIFYYMTSQKSLILADVCNFLICCVSYRRRRWIFLTPVAKGAFVLLHLCTTSMAMKPDSSITSLIMMLTVIFILLCGAGEQEGLPPNALDFQLETARYWNNLFLIFACINGTVDYYSFGGSWKLVACSLGLRAALVIMISGVTEIVYLEMQQNNIQ